MQKVIIEKGSLPIRYHFVIELLQFYWIYLFLAIVSMVNKTLVFCASNQDKSKYSTSYTFRQIEIVLKDSTAFVYVTKSV